MSVYSHSSVGTRLAASRVLAPGAPSYDALTQLLAESVRRKSKEEAAKRSDATAVLFPYALGAIVMSEIMGDYPEYRMIPINSCNPVEKEWCAHRFMAMNVCIDSMLRYSKHITVVGSALLQCGTRNLRDVHLEGDGGSLVGVHTQHEAQEEYVKVARSRERVEQLYSYSLPSSTFSDYLAGRCLQLCEEGSGCSHRSDAMVFDLSLYAMSVEQVAYAMLQSDAQIATAILPYTPDVFRVDSGVVHKSSGVEYSVEGKAGQKKFKLMYPEGVAGVQAYDYEVWAEWLKSSTIAIRTRSGKTESFRIELEQHRGPFMYVGIVRLAESQPPGSTVHALEMPWARDKTVVTFNRLKSIMADPLRAESWEEATIIAADDVIEKIYTYALGLEQSQFTPEAIMRRVSKVDSRVITAGVNVRVRVPLAPEIARDLSGAIYGRAFVVRYEMGRLGQDMMASMAKITAFAAADRGTKILMMCSAGIAAMHRSTLGKLDAYVNNFVANWMVSHGTSTSQGAMMKAPEFLLLQDYNSRYAAVKRAVLNSIKGRSIVSPGLRGAKAAAVYGARLSSKMLQDDYVDLSVPVNATADVEAYARQVVEENDTGHTGENRFEVHVTTAVPEVPQGHEGPESFDPVEDPVGTINDIMEGIFPGMKDQAFEDDQTTMRFYPQHRDVQAEYLVHPLDDPTKPVSQAVYESKLDGYNVRRKPQTLQETLTAIGARNLAAPTLRVAADETAAVLETWDNMRDFCLVPDLEARLAPYKHNKLTFEQDVIKEWGKQANPTNIKKVLRYALDHYSFEDARPWEYEIMLKSDAKPPLSVKPLTQVIPPQVIAMQDKNVSSLFSSIFRVISRRLISILKPEVMLNLLKSTDDIRDHIAAHHPFGEEGLIFLENDFSKFDKSQDRFTYMVMSFIFEKLGFDDELLDRWVDSNERCTLKSLALGIILVVMWQNKSGGPATALQNVLANLAACATAYKGTVLLYAAFMGDDSLVVCRKLCASEQSLRKMAEMFNFEAKFFVLEHPYFVSNFILFDHDAKKVFMVPDPVKRCQKYSQAVTAENPQWEDKYRSANETLMPYRHSRDLHDLEAAVRERYGLARGIDLLPLFDSLATVGASFEAFRGLYKSDVTVFSL